MASGQGNPGPSRTVHGYIIVGTVVIFGIAKILDPTNATHMQKDRMEKFCAREQPGGKDQILIRYEMYASGGGRRRAEADDEVRFQELERCGFGDLLSSSISR
ncbi:MAG: hypothetical protein ETSY1_18445 [Candidatus Entotheonella factor]|uniref:Uncharacterized protein n=1 Tax=Entotheonella factor TaxID=1429438 RepID=W4LKK1_ENTF1|nr:MAG: hypothetical protein ETSY1_18445 [Candidatus Entotheonella factor]